MQEFVVVAKAYVSNIWLPGFDNLFCLLIPTSYLPAGDRGDFPKAWVTATHVQDLDFLDPSFPFDSVWVIL